MNSQLTFKIKPSNKIYILILFVIGYSAQDEILLNSSRIDIYADDKATFL